jgi:hypothetical protein
MNLCRFFIIFLIFLLFQNIVSAENAIVVKSGTTVPFNASKIDAFSGFTLTNASWDFADDTVGTGLYVLHDYIYNGVYRVIVNATDNQGEQHESGLAVIYGGSVPLIPDSESYVAIYFTKIPDGIFNLVANQYDYTNMSTSGYSSIGKFFNITSDMPEGSFNSTMMFSYNDQDNDGIVDDIGVSEDSLDPYFYNGTSWTKIDNAVKYKIGNRIAAHVDHFTLFALLSTATPITPPGSEPPPSGSTGSNTGSSGGSGGTGSSGSVAPNRTPVNATVQQCQENWSCIDWSVCLNDVQTRTCTDKNKCGTTNSKPSLIRTCVVSNETVPESTTNQPESLLDMSTYYWLLIISAGVIVVLIVLISRRKTKKWYERKLSIRRLKNKN